MTKVKAGIGERDIVWTPHPGSQELFLTAPTDECLIHGSRGGGKTDVLIMDYLQHVGLGYGEAWRGILFREEYTELTDIINKCHRWVRQIFPEAKYNGSEHKWSFSTGEMLYLRYMKKPSDYWNYHGHEYPWIGWEELTNWPIDECYNQMMSCNRCSILDVPRKIRATCNPAGPGHGWVKNYYIDVSNPVKIYVDPDTERSRCHIPSRLEENTALLEADPNYANTIMAAVRDDPVKYKAWVLGEWDIVAGGALTDVWEPKKQIFKPVPFPQSWHVYRSFDWGSAKPWSVTYAAEANGEQFDPEYNMPFIPRDSMFIIDELYGWDGTVNKGDYATSDQIAERVLAKDEAIAREYGCRVLVGPADTNIYEVRDGSSIANNMARYGLHWKRAYKGSGSRVAGLSMLRQMLAASKRGDLENPGVYFFDRARHHMRTFPLLQYDEKKYEDVDTEQEDHCVIGSTLVHTDKGTVPIKDLVGTEGKVLSVGGKYVPYYNCKQYFDKSELVRVTFDDGSYVDCTPDHKFLTNDGLIEALQLTPYDTQCIVSENPKGGSLWKRSLNCQRINKNFVERCTTGAVSIFKNVVTGFTEQFGSTSTEKYQKVGMCTTKMKIKPITNLITFNWLRGQNTVLCTNVGTIGECQKNVWKQQQSGTVVSRVKSGTISTMKTLKVYCTKRLKGNAPLVGSSIKRTIRMVTHSAQTTASQLLGGLQELIQLLGNVAYVQNSSILTNTQKEKRVVQSAELNSVKSISVKNVQMLPHKEPTYCLTAEGTHLFAVGSGVLISNCYDSTRYMLTRKYTRLKHRKVRI